MNFDVREYAMRLAKADPERFRLNVSITCTWWHLADATNKADVYAGCYAYEAWAFIGPLADELGVANVGTIDLDETGCHRLEYNKRLKTYAPTPPLFDSLLEAVFAAVCAKLDSRPPTGGDA